MNKYSNFIINQRWFVIIITLIFIVIMGNATRYLEFTNDYKAFFKDDNIHLLNIEKIEKKYTKNSNILVVIEPKDNIIFSKETLIAIHQLTEQLWQIPFSSRIDSLSNFQYSYAIEDDIIVEDLIQNPESLTPSDIQRIKEIALSESLLRNKLISEKAHVAGINISFSLTQAQTETELVGIIKEVRKLRSEFEATHKTIKLHLTGNEMFNNAFPEASDYDAQTLIPIMFALIILFLGYLLRSINGVISILIIIVFSVISAMGFAGLAEIKQTSASASAPLIILSLAVASCVHYLITTFNLLREGYEKQAALIESLQLNIRPIFLTSLTTIIGFLSMNMSDSPPFHDLGNMTAIGVAMSFIFVVTFFPALLSLIPLKASNKTLIKKHHTTIIANIAIKHKKKLLGGFVALSLVTIIFIPNNELNDNLVEDFDKRMEFRQATEFTSQNLTGIYNMEYSLISGEKGGVSNPDFLLHVESFSNWYRAQPETLHVISFTDIIKRLNKNMHNDDEAWYRLPTERNLAAQYLLFYEMSLPYGLGLSNIVDIDKSATRLTVTLKNLSSQELLSIERRAEQWLANNAPNFSYIGASQSMAFAHISYSNIRSMLFGTIAALIIISLILVIAFRSIKIGLISLLPNILPIMLTFGLWGAFVGEIGMAAAVISAIVLGIIVDDTVHFLNTYLRAKRTHQLNDEDAIRYTFNHVGEALITTTIVLMMGFLVLAQSSFAINAEIGTLSAMAIFLAIMTDVLLLPALLIIIGQQNKNNRLSTFITSRCCQTHK